MLQKSKLLVLVLMAIAVSFAISIAAVDGSEEESKSGVYRLEEIVVRETSPPDPGVTIIEPERLEAGIKFNLEDMLNHEPDVSLSRRGRVGDNSDSLSIRGFSGNRILLNINGRPMNSAGVNGGYFIDWNTITLDNVEKIEIIKGGSSARYSNTLGGIVNVTTKKPSQKPETVLFADYGTGDFDMYTLRATHSNKVGPFGCSIAASYQNSDAFLWNNDFKGKNVNLYTTYDLPTEGVFSFGFRYTYNEVGYIRNNRAVDQDSGDPEDPDDPGYNTPINPDYPAVTGVFLYPTVGHAFIPGTGSYMEKTTLLYDIGWTQPIKKGIFDAKVYWNDETMRDRNYASHDIVWFTGDTSDQCAEGELVLDQEIETDRSRGGRIDYSYPFDFGDLLGDHELGIGIERHEVRFGDKKYNYVDPNWNSVYDFDIPDYPGYGPSNEAINHGCYIEDNWQASDHILLNLGFRYDHFNNKALDEEVGKDFSEWALFPKITGTYNFNEGSSITTSVYRAFRAPSQPEIYWWSHPNIFSAHGLSIPDPEEEVLNAEKSKAIELTYQRKLEIGQTRIAGWYYWVDDYIMMRFDPRAYIAYNIDEARLYGFALDMNLGLTHWLSIYGTLAYQQSHKNGDFLDADKKLDGIDYIPEWKASAGTDIKLPYDILLSFNARYIGKRKALYLYGGWGRDEQQTVVEIDDYVLLDMGLKIPLIKHVELGLRVEDLFNTDYKERFGYPMPGRIFGMDLKTTF